jgi:hypothetical protein
MTLHPPGYQWNPNSPRDKLLTPPHQSGDIYHVRWVSCDSCDPKILIIYSDSKPISAIKRDTDKFPEHDHEWSYKDYQGFGELQVPVCIRSEQANS